MFKYQNIDIFIRDSMFIINGLNAITTFLGIATTQANWGVGTSEKDYTDNSLEDVVLTKSITSTELKGSNELLVLAEIDYAEANGEMISETGLVAITGQMTVSGHNSLEKNAAEKYNYFYDIYVVPKEALL